MPICLTFDVERDYYEIVADRRLLAYKQKTFSMLERAIPKILKISDEYGIPYTFFLCGEVAENCPHLFKGLEGKHSIGVHTHPFTHERIFKGSSPNDREEDRLEKYTFQQQYDMISTDVQLIAENLDHRPKIFRAGKHSVSKVTFKVLEALGFTIDCSIHPPFQFIGWYPFRIPNSSIWEIPTYCDMSPEISPQIAKLFKFTSIIRSFLRLNETIYVGIIHPMIFGNPTINTEILFDTYKQMIEKCLEFGFEFLTVEDAFKRAKGRGKIWNMIGGALSVSVKPIYYFITRYGAKSILNPSMGIID